MHRVEYIEGVYRNKCGGGQNMRKALKNLHFTVQLPYKDYFISPSNKTSRKKQQIIFLNTLHYSVLDLKSVTALSSRGGYVPPLQV